MIPFLVGFFLGGTLGILAMALVAAGKITEDKRLNREIFRSLVESDGFAEDWPYRVESRYENGPLVVRTYYNADDSIHHIDRGIT